MHTESKLSFWVQMANRTEHWLLRGKILSFWCYVWNHAKMYRQTNFLLRARGVILLICLIALSTVICHSFYLQVAERALFLWNNDHIENLIKQNRKVILPIIFPALERNTRQHWNQAVQSLTLNVRKIFSDIDLDLFEECLLKFQEDETREKEMKVKREVTWKRLEEIAAVKATTNEPVLVSPKVMARALSG